MGEVLKYAGWALLGLFLFAWTNLLFQWINWIGCIGMRSCDYPPDGSAGYYRMYAGGAMFMVTVVVMMIGAVYRVYLEIVQNVGPKEEKTD